MTLLCNKTLAAVTIFLTILMFSSGAYAFGLKSKIQDEIDGNPFLEKEGIKLRVTEEKNGYVTIEMYEGYSQIRRSIIDGLKVSQLNTASGDKYYSHGAEALQLTMDALQKIKGVKSIMLTAELIIEENNTLSEVEKNKVSSLLKESHLSFEMKDYPDAINKSTIVINIDPKNINAYMTLAVAYTQQGNISKACASLEKAIVLGNRQGAWDIRWQLSGMSEFDKIQKEPCFQKLIKGN